MKKVQGFYTDIDDIVSSLDIKILKEHLRDCINIANFFMCKGVDIKSFLGREIALLWKNYLSYFVWDYIRVMVEDLIRRADDESDNYTKEYIELSNDLGHCFLINEILNEYGKPKWLRET